MMNEREAMEEEIPDEAWDATCFLDRHWNYGEVGGGRALAIGYIGGLAQQQRAQWEAAEAEIAEAIFHARYRDDHDVFGELTEREKAASWEELAGSALLVSRETARKRFRDRVEAIRVQRLRDRAEAQAELWGPSVEERAEGEGVSDSANE